MKNVFYSIILASLFFSCGKKDDAPAPSSEPNAHFAFLKDNHQWTYDYDLLGNAGTLTMTTDSIETNLYKIINQYDSDSPYSTYWFVSGPYLKTYQDGSSKENAVTIYKYNPSVNDSWSHTDASTNRTTYYKVLSTNETIATSAGTFNNCKKIEVSFSYA